MKKKVSKTKDKGGVRLADASFLLSASRSSHFPDDDVPELAFAGRSNVGKSSLMNAMMNRKNLVRTSSKPGCTTAINFFQVVAAQPLGWTARLVDLPGFGYARRSKSERASWGPLIEGYLQQREQLMAVVLLVDMRRGIEDEEQMLVEFLRSASATPPEIIVAATKADKLARSALKPRLAALSKQVDAPVIGVSAKTGDGVDPLWKLLIRRMFRQHVPGKTEGGENATRDEM